MQTVSTVAEMIALAQQWPIGESIGLVPTMGYLHDGHLSLARAAQQECEHVVVSIFFNPSQFGPHEDFARYPRDLPRDLKLLEGVGVEYVFTPTADAVYPAGFACYVDPTGRLVDAGECNAEMLRAALAQVIATEPRAHLDYADVCDPNTMLPLARIEPDQSALLALAARVGPVRLIDNFLRYPNGVWDGD